MITLFIVLTILALVLFVLFVNIHILFTYDKKASVVIRVLFFRFRGEKLIERFKKDKKEDGEKSSSEGKDFAKAEENKPQKGSLLDFTRFLIHVADVIRLAVKELFSRIKIRLKEFTLIIGTDDAAKTALAYGGAIQAANALCVLLQRFSDFRCDNRKLRISPDFSSEKSSFSIDLDLSVKLYHILILLLHTYIRFFEGKDRNHERNSVETGH